MLPCFTQDILSTTPSQQLPSIRSPRPTTFIPHTHTHTHRTHTWTCAQPRHPSPHHPQTSPLSLFQGAHGKPPESAGLRRTWAWPNSFPWLWTWDHPLLIFFELSLSLCCLCFLFPHSSVLADHCVIFTSLFTLFPTPQLSSSSPFSLSLDFCSRDWHLKVIWLPSKGS